MAGVYRIKKCLFCSFEPEMTTTGSSGQTDRVIKHMLKKHGYDIREKRFVRARPTIGPMRERKSLKKTKKRAKKD